MGASPDQVDLLIDFLNTVDVEAGTDTLDRARDYAAWCRARGQHPGDVGAARRVRDGLRAALRGEAAALPPVTVPVAASCDGGVRLAPADLAQAVLTAAAAVTLAGDWNRVKLCPADRCLEAFFDRSRNRSRVWCDMADCGNLAKVRGHRARAAG